jgi:hypothetical protein
MHWQFIKKMLCIFTKKISHLYWHLVEHHLVFLQFHVLNSQVFRFSAVKDPDNHSYDIYMDSANSLECLVDRSWNRRTNDLDQWICYGYFEQY